MGSESKNTLVTKEEIMKSQEFLDVLRADVGKLSDNKKDLQSDVFGTSFLRKHTLRYNSFRDFVEDSPSKIQSEKLKNSREIDFFVREETVFDDWDEMKQRAIEEWIVANVTLD